jgi:hypothetical protein
VFVGVCCIGPVWITAEKTSSSSVFVDGPRWLSLACCGTAAVFSAVWAKVVFAGLYAQVEPLESLFPALPSATAIRLPRSPAVADLATVAAAIAGEA